MKKVGGNESSRKLAVSETLCFLFLGVTLIEKNIPFARFCFLRDSVHKHDV